MKAYPSLALPLGSSWPGGLPGSAGDRMPAGINVATTANIAGMSVIEEGETRRQTSPITRKNPPAPQRLLRSLAWCRRVTPRVVSCPAGTNWRSLSRFVAISSKNAISTSCERPLISLTYLPCRRGAWNPQMLPEVQRRSSGYASVCQRVVFERMLLGSPRSLSGVDAAYLGVVGIASTTRGLETSWKISPRSPGHRR